MSVLTAGPALATRRAVAKARSPQGVLAASVRSWRAGVVETPAEHDATLRLRHAIYIDQMGLLPKDHPYVQDGRLVDPWDDHSWNITLWADGVAVGTVRLSAGAPRPLELESAVDLSAHLADTDRPRTVEVTRLMIDRRYRSTRATATLFIALYRTLRAYGIRQVFVAGKVGSLSRYWENFGFERLGEETFTYPVVPGARYSLMRWRLPSARSLRGRLQNAVFEASAAVAFHLPRLIAAAYRQGLHSERT